MSVVWEKQILVGMLQGVGMNGKQELAEREECQWDPLKVGIPDSERGGCSKSGRTYEDQRGHLL